MIELPEILNRENLNEVWVDATPDGHYAQRILQAFRQRALVRYQVHGIPEERTALYDLMNEHQAARVQELDETLMLLKRPHPQGLGEPGNCPQCGAGVDGSHAYCGHCGTRLRLTCSSCCQPLPPRGGTR